MDIRENGKDRGGRRKPAGPGGNHHWGRAGRSLLGRRKLSSKRLSSGGVIWRPAAGQRVLVIECEGGQRVVAGAVQEAGRPDLENGEVLIESGAASIRLKNSGEILIKGRVNIEGELTVGGVPIG